eukprot:m.134084 g.134084  ORF g.134084 m.134084 type:complete len:70 (+) comp15814_c3_seq3:442-651(+)
MSLSPGLLVFIGSCMSFSSSLQLSYNFPFTEKKYCAFFVPLQLLFDVFDPFLGEFIFFSTYEKKKKSYS